MSRGLVRDPAPPEWLEPPPPAGVAADGRRPPRRSTSRPRASPPIRASTRTSTASRRPTGRRSSSRRSSRAHDGPAAPLQRARRRGTTARCWCGAGQRHPRRSAVSAGHGSPRCSATPARPASAARCCGARSRSPRVTGCPPSGWRSPTATRPRLLRGARLRRHAQSLTRRALTTEHEGPARAGPSKPGHRSPLNYYIPGLKVFCLGGLTLLTTWTGRRPEGRRVATAGSARAPVAKWAIRRTTEARRDRVAPQWTHAAHAARPGRASAAARRRGARDDPALERRARRRGRPGAGGRAGAAASPQPGDPATCDADRRARRRRHDARRAAHRGAAAGRPVLGVACGSLGALTAVDGGRPRGRRSTASPRATGSRAGCPRSPSSPRAPSRWTASTTS